MELLSDVAKGKPRAPDVSFDPTASLDPNASFDPNQVPTLQPDVLVDVLDGAQKGQRLPAFLEGPSGSQSKQLYGVGDEVVVQLSLNPDGTYFVSASDRWRVPVLAGIVGLFALAVTVVGGWRGIRSLLALALTLGVVTRIVIPLILRGWNPVLLAIVAATSVTIATLILTEGLRRSTIAAVLGTFAALALTGGLAVVFTALAQFTDLQGNEDIAFLQSFVSGIDIRGLLLAAVIFGALGVLDDVTITQAATVHELNAADPNASRTQLFRRSMNVGRSHIAATVNTLVLAYVGASLPLLVLFAVGRQPLFEIGSGETVAVEVIRALVGSIGIVAAVPLTTAMAVLLASPEHASAGRVARAPGWD